MSCLTAQMLSAVLLPGVKPAWVGPAMLNTYPFSLSYTQRAYTLYAVTNRLMPLYPVGPEGSLCGFSMGMMMDMPQSIGKIQSLQMIMIIRKSQSLAIAEYLYTSAGMSSHPCRHDSSSVGYKRCPLPPLSDLQGLRPAGRGGKESGLGHSSWENTSNGMW